MSELCHSNDEKCRVSWTVTPSTSLLSAHFIMSRYGMSQLPVISEHVEDHRGGLPVGVLDRECISLACRLAILLSTLHYDVSLTSEQFMVVI